MIALEVARELAKQFEGIEDGDALKPGLQPYRDPTGYWTIGYGHLITRDREIEQPDMTWTMDEAERNLEIGMTQRIAAVLRLTTVALTDDQIAALADFAYNLGVGALRASTLLRKANAGHFDGAALEFPKWKFSGGVVLPGLVRRRAAEAELWIN